MALTLDEIQSITQDFWYPGAADNYFTGNVLMYRLLKNGGIATGGVKIRQVIWYGSPDGGSFGPSSTFDTTRREKMNAARFDWALHYEPVTYNIEDKIKNNGPEAEVDSVMTKLDMAQKGIKDSMADALYSTGVAIGDEWPITGLQGMINATSSTSYGTIAEDDMSVWKPGAVTTTAEALTLPVMRTLKRNCQVGDANEDRPSLYITTTTLRDVYEALLQPQQRFSDDKLASAGFSNLLFDTVAPVVGDMKCPSGFMFALNENMLDFKSHTDFKFHHEPWMRPTNQYLFTMQIIWSGNLTCKRRGAHGSHSNLS